jgi:KDO2-lipid IV(A) lauroyltransferase
MSAKKISFSKHVQYLAELFLAVFFLFLIKMMGLRLASHAIGKLVRWLGPKMKVSKVAHKNLMFMKPQLSYEQRERTVADCWENLGRVIGELPHWHAVSDEFLQQHVEIHNPPSQACFKRGFLLISAHFGNWELYPRVMQYLGQRLSMVYRPANNPYVDALINSYRRACGIRLLPKGVGGLRSVLKELRAGAAVGMLLDQKVSEGKEVLFVGKPAKCSSAPVLLVEKYQLPIFISFVERVDGIKYRVKFVEIKLESGRDLLQVINDHMSEMILQNPAQWFLVHKRWDKSEYR